MENPGLMTIPDNFFQKSVDVPCNVIIAVLKCPSDIITGSLSSGVIICGFVDKLQSCCVIAGTRFDEATIRNTMEIFGK